jgi:2-hydroxychromene-2-carboxylate isomerase
MTASNLTIEYYYALASPWSYLGNQKLWEIAARYGVEIDPVIIDYDHMFEAAGTIPLPKRPPLRKAYRLIELRRWSERRGVRLNAEPRHYMGEIEEPDERLGALMVTAAKMAGHDSLKLAHAIGRALWAEERAPFHEAELVAIAKSVGMDGHALLAAARSEVTARQYEAQTRHSIERGVFGMPFYILRDEPFWGQDRLELLEAAVERAVGGRR